MSTRCLICKKLPDGKVLGIYCHHDGNLRWVGRTLLDCYTEEKKIVLHDGNESYEWLPNIVGTEL